MAAPEDPAALFDMPKALPSDLAGRFGIPPLTVFDRRQGYWQNRRRRWLELGIDSGDGRDIALTYAKSQGGDEVSQKLLAMSGGTSVFDPVLAETMIRWYAPPAGLIFDPFAGGSVRGIVSYALGRSYLGCDIRPEQLEVNVEQLATFTAAHGATDAACRWRLQDGTQPFEDDTGDADMILTCPPYGDLEVYSDRADDISNMGYDDFADAYCDAVYHAAGRLADNRFSVWVVGNYRNQRTGHLRDLVGLTIGAHVAAGLHYHAEAVIVDPVGTGAMRASATFKALRRPIRTHQQVLIFVKGDVHAAATAAPPFTEDMVEDMWSGG
jgi:hypothetical protein